LTRDTPGTVLITGTSGFSGPYVADAFSSRGYKVIRWVSPGDRSDEGEAIEITDSSAVLAALADARPDYVVHLAAISHVVHGDDRAYYAVNLFGTTNLLDACARVGTAKKVIIASSANVYGVGAGAELDESVCPRPVNHYGCSKLAMEHMAWTFASQLPLIIVRPFNYTGAGQDERFLVPKLVAHFRKGSQEIELGNIEVSRDFSDVRDVAQAYVALAECGATSEVVNVCSGRAVSIREIINHLEVIAGYSIQVRVAQALVRGTDIPVLMGNNSRLSKLTGFRPSIPLESTLRWMYGHES
jgi:GDP-6-deoxy-D-talose 4-dehydrogenase